MAAFAVMFLPIRIGHIGREMSRTPTPTALCSAMPVPEGELPEWIHLLTAGRIDTQDGRGPYTVPSMAALAETLNAGGKLALDECHSTDLAAPKGMAAPARGWMTAFEARDDGLWAQVKWNGQGRALMEDGAYNGISPVIVHDSKNRVIGLLRASLTNTPNLKGLTALHSQDDLEGADMDWKAKLIEVLGLDAETDDGAIETALNSKLTASAAHAQELDVTTNPAFIALQGELAETAKRLNTLTEATARDKSTTFVDGAIAEGRVGVKAMRERYITMHQKNASETEELINALPKLVGAALQGEVVEGADDKGLDAGDRRVTQLMGLSEEAYLESRNASGTKKEAL